MIPTYIQALADQAHPQPTGGQSESVPLDDFGSKRQIDAENTFMDAALELIPNRLVAQFEAFALGATLDERIAEVLRLIDAEPVLEVALRAPLLPLAISVITQALDIKDTDIIEEEFTEKDAQTYLKLENCFRRAVFLRSWYLAELTQAAENVGARG